MVTDNYLLLVVTTHPEEWGLRRPRATPDDAGMQKSMQILTSSAVTNRLSLSRGGAQAPWARQS